MSEVKSPKTYNHSTGNLQYTRHRVQLITYVHIDIVGPLPPSKGYSYLLTCTDHFTRWPEAFPLTNITAESLSQTFVNGWISRFRIPSTITSDRGKQFESTLWGHLMQLLGCKRIRTTAYHLIRYSPTTISHTRYTLHVVHACFSVDREIITHVPTNSHTRKTRVIPT